MTQEPQGTAIPDPLHVLQRMGGRRFIEDLAAELQSVSDSVVLRGRPGGLTMKVKIEQVNPGEPQVSVEYVIVPQHAAKPARSQTYYVHDGGMHATDPRQAQLEFHTVELGTGEVVHEVPHEEREVREVG
jgi:hypothetical protein